MSPEAAGEPRGPPLARLAPLRKGRDYVARPPVRERPRQAAGFVLVDGREHLEANGVTASPQRPLLHGTKAN
jgi:hypothetical protein